MNIPQVNAGATDRNREQAEWIVKKLGYAYYPDHELDAEYRRCDCSAVAWKGPEDNRRLPNGSFTLCQVVGMLEAEKIVWENENDHGWVMWLPNKNYKVVLGHTNPHDLTAAMDALIKVLETKKGKTK